MMGMWYTCSFTTVRLVHAEIVGDLVSIEFSRRKKNEKKDKQRTFLRLAQVIHKIGGFV